MLSRSSQAIVWIVLLGLTGLGLGAAFGPLVWQVEMVTPFRLQWLLVSVGCLALSLWSRRWLLVGLAVAALVCNLAPMIARLADRKSLPATTSVAHSGHPLSLVFSNVLCDNRQFDRVIGMVTHEAPDIFVAAETTPEWVEHLDRLKPAYPYSYAPRDLGIFGLSLYAKTPFTAQVYRIGPRKMPLLRAEFTDFILLAAHPMPPARRRLTEENRLYIDALAQRVQTERKPVIIAGDLNATLWSHNMQPLMQANMQWPSGSGMAYSWPSRNPLMAIQIDHVLTKGFSAGTYRVLADTGSDHFPVRADLVW